MLARTSTRSLSSATRQAVARPARRGLSTAQTGGAQQQAGASHAAAGVAGGAVVLGALYGYYHYSGTAKVVATTKQTIAQAEAVKDKVVGATPNPSQALGLLRSVAKSYAAAIPGAAGAVDASFDQLDRLASEHGEKVQQVLSETYAEVQKAASGGGKDAGEKVVAALTAAVGKVQQLVGEEGGKAFEGLKEKFPQLGKSLGGEFEELSKLADKHGPEASRIASSFYNEASRIVQKGGMNGETLDAVRDLLQRKSAEIRDLSTKAGKEAWEASAKQAEPLLKKMPDVQKMLDQQLGKLEGVVGEDRVKVVKSLYADLEKIGKSGKSVDEMTAEAKKLVESKVGSLDLDNLKSQAQSKGGDMMDGAMKYASAVPGLGGIAKALEGTDLASFKDLAEKHGEKGEQLLSSTYEEIKQLLQKKSEEAKKLAAEAQKDAKKEVKK